MANEDIKPEQTQLTRETAEHAWSVINKCQNIAIISHRNPDPDCIGSNLSLKKVLENKGKVVQSFCVNSPPNSCAFLKDVESFQQNFNPQKFDLIISMDCGGQDQLGYEILKTHQSVPFLNIDHHASNNYFGTINLVYPNYSSTSEIIFRLLNLWEITPSPEIATNLLIGLYYDTGSFMHSNVTPEVLKIASSLMHDGADIKAIRKHLFQNFNQTKYHIWGEALENIYLTKHGTAIAVIDDANGDRENLSGLIDYVSMTQNSKFAVMITQEDSELIKGSLRTRYDNINLSEMATKLGGGGHRKASGFSLPGKVEKQCIWTIINQ